MKETKHDADPDNVITLHQYNAKGELEFTAVDINRNDVIDFGGSDRITRTLSDAFTNSFGGILRTRTWVHSVNGSTATRLVSTVERIGNGLRTWQTSYRDASTPVTTQTLIEPGKTTAPQPPAIAPSR